MTTVRRRPPAEDISGKAEEIFKRDIEPNTRPDQLRDFVMIDVDSGDFEIDPDELAASHRLRERRPEARIWMRKVGSPYARRFGGRRPSASISGSTHVSEHQDTP